MSGPEHGGIRTSLVLDGQLQVLQVSAIAVAMITRENEVSFKRMTLLLDIGNLVARTLVKAARSSLQDCGTHEGCQEKQGSPHVENSPGESVECTTGGSKRDFKVDQ